VIFERRKATSAFLILAALMGVRILAREAVEAARRGRF